MTQEELQREAEELERLIRERDNWINRYNQLVVEHNAVLRELEVSANAAAAVTNAANAARSVVVPKLGGSVEHVTQVANLIKGVQTEIELLSSKYFIVKNISTASKKMTELNNEYQRNFGLYNLLRRVALGYVVGIDTNIISNETLRKTVEKNYLQNADYWVSHCLMATMLWVSDEREAAERAINKAMTIDPHKSSLYFLLINLHFGRKEAAAKWFEYYIRDIDISNIGNEIRILLQAYLYNICGDDLEFKNKIAKEFDDLLKEVRSSNINYSNVVRARVLEFISAHVHKTHKEFVNAERTCKDYSRLLEALDCAEKNSVFAEEFEELYNENSEAPANLIARIQNVLYDLINTYDEAEMQIIKSMDYNEMILNARGDVNAAQKMYSTKYREQKAQTMGDLMVRLAFPSGSDEVDVRVRKFAVSFLCENIIAAFKEFKNQYNRIVGDRHEVRIDTFPVVVDEKNPEEAVTALKDAYKKNKKKLISRDKKVRTITGFTVAFWIAFAISLAVTVIASNVSGVLSVKAVIVSVALFVLGSLFIFFLVNQRKKAGEQIDKRMQESVEILNKVIAEIKDWREKFKAADEQSAKLIEVLMKFVKKEEVAQNE